MARSGRTTDGNATPIPSVVDEIFLLPMFQVDVTSDDQ